MERDKEIKFLKENATYLYSLWVVIKGIRETHAGKLAELDQPLRSSVVRNFILGLACLLDPVEQGGNKNLSIYLLGDDIDLTFYADVIEKVRTFRSKAIAHNDRETMFTGDSFFDQYPVRPEEVEGLLMYMIERIQFVCGIPFPTNEIERPLIRKLNELLG